MKTSFFVLTLMLCFNVHAQWYVGANAGRSLGKDYVIKDMPVHRDCNMVGLIGGYQYIRYENDKPYAILEGQVHVPLIHRYAYTSIGLSAGIVLSITNDEEDRNNVWELIPMSGLYYSLVSSERTYMNKLTYGYGLRLKKDKVYIGCTNIRNTWEIRIGLLGLREY